MPIGSLGLLHSDINALLSKWKEIENYFDIWKEIWFSFQPFLCPFI